MRISTTHLHALLHVKKVIEQMKALMQMLVDDEAATTEEGENADVSRVSFP